MTIWLRTLLQGDGCRGCRSSGTDGSLSHDRSMIAKAPPCVRRCYGVPCLYHGLLLRSSTRGLGRGVTCISFLICLDCSKPWYRLANAPLVYHCIAEVHEPPVIESRKGNRLMKPQAAAATLAVTCNLQRPNLRLRVMTVPVTRRRQSHL